ncbi:MAG: hypothetical protein MJZ16_11930 [Bacteroidales bacterium]|nr:hypothetical protein [Bacteroidales bacterium]
MSLFDKISSLITGSKPEKREPENVSSSVDEAPIVVVEDPTQIKGQKPQKVIVVAPVINKPTKVSIKRNTQESVAHFPTKASVYGDIPFEDSNYSKYRKATIMLPEFDFYTGKKCDQYDENSPEAQTIKELNKWAADKMGEAMIHEKNKEFDKAAAIYEELVHHRYWEREPYRRLLNIYNKAGLTRQALSIVQMANAHFRKISQEQEARLLLLAERYKCKAYAEKIIAEGKDLSYYDGLFFIYRSSLALDHDSDSKA